MGDIMKINPLIKKFWKGVKEGDDKRIATQPIPDNYDEILDVEYIDDGHIHHRYDVFRPAGNGEKLPLIIDIHGGGWYYGDKELNGYFCKHLTSHNFVVASISYRLCPEVDFFNQIKDCVCAIKHILARADEYNFDKDNVFIAGDSAGGHIVGIICNLINSKDLQAKYDVDIDFAFNACALICPACEPCEMLPLISNIYFNPLFGKKHRRNGIMQLTSFKSTLQENVIPTIVLTSYADMLKTQSLDCYTLLKQREVDCDLIFGEKVKGGNKLEHVFNVVHWEWEESKKANEQICLFFNKRLNK